MRTKSPLPEDIDAMALRFPHRLLAIALTGGVAVAALAACADEPRRELEVTATAYNSLPRQTQGDPAVTAWGDRLEPGMKAIAVSRDLIPMGLTHRTPVRIEGFPGEYLVLDKLHKRFTRRIDIYMGVDRKKALAFGKRTLRISWPGAPES